MSHIKQISDVLSEQARNVYAGLSLLFPSLPAWVVGRRADCLIKTCKKVQEKLDQSGLAPDHIRECSLKLGISWIEKASLEEDERLQGLWANLLTKALTPSFSPDQLQPAFVSIIGELTPWDAKVLQIIYHTWVLENEKKLDPELVDVFFDTDIPDEQFELSMNNLTRLGLIMTSETTDFIQTGSQKALVSCQPRLSPLGHAFVSVCVMD